MGFRMMLYCIPAEYFSIINPADLEDIYKPREHLEIQDVLCSSPTHWSQPPPFLTSFALTSI